MLAAWVSRVYLLVSEYVSNLLGELFSTLDILGVVSKVDYS